ncbi:MAG: prolyl oligopeptidase family serine peptidase [Acidobacteriota bacterium]
MMWPRAEGVTTARALVTSCMLAGCWLVSAQAGAAGPSATDPVAIEHLMAKPRVAEVDLSPAGDRIAYRLDEEIGSSLWLVDLDGGAVRDDSRRELLRSENLESVDWAPDGSSLFLQTSDRLASLDLAPGARARWIARLGRVDEAPDRSGVRSAREVRLLRVEPDRPRSVTLRAELRSVDGADDSYRLLRVDASGHVETVLETPIRFVDALDAGDGTVILHRPDGETLEQVFVARRSDGSEVELVRCDAIDPCRLVAVVDGTLWLRGRFDGDLAGVSSLRLEAVLGDRSGSDRARLALGRQPVDPIGRTDLETLVVEPTSGRPLLAVHAADGHRLLALAPGLGGHLQHIATQLAGGAFDLEPRLDANGAARGTWLVVERGARLHHDRHHLYDPRTGRLSEVLAAERLRGAPVPSERLARARFVEYSASDGRTVYGWLLLPSAERGADARLGVEVPLVVTVHGGPWSHVRGSFSPLTQRLAARGMAVFAPNFRGSTGYGRAYVAAADGDFGDGRVQQDVVDGVHRLLGRRVEELRGLDAVRLTARTDDLPSLEAPRVAIMGHSFGGFTTLGALAFTPRLARAGIASAAPVDLVRAFRDLEIGDRMPSGLRLRAVLRRWLVDFDDPQVAARLRRSSPEAGLDAVERPLMLLAGGLDPKVDIADVRAYALALARRGVDVSLVVDEDAGHSIEGEDAVRLYLEVVDRFLAHHLGVESAPGSDSSDEVAGWRQRLDEQVEIAGASLAPLVDREGRLRPLAPAAAPRPASAADSGAR